MANQQTTPKKENILLSILLNIVIPSVILSKLSGPDWLGPVWGLITGLSFPFCYGIWDFIQRKKVNFISILGIISLLLTGGIGLLHLDTKWIAIKEATVPLLIGIAVLISLKTRYPLVRTLFYNDTLLDTQKVHQALDSQGNVKNFEVKLVHVSYLLAGSFLVSAILNYVLAKIIVISPSGTEAFNAEIGKMIWLSYPVIVVPSMIVMIGALWYLFSSIKKLSGLSLEEIVHHQLAEKKTPSDLDKQ